MQNLISVGALITQSWEHFLKFFKENARIALIGFSPSILMGVLQAFNGSKNSLVTALAGLLGLASIVASLWMSIVLTKQVLKQDGAHIKNDKAWHLYILPLLLIGILTGLLTLVGFIFFVLPGIWLAVSLSYGQVLLFEDDIHGTNAMRASHELVKGRWWPVFGRTLAVGIVFGFAFMVIMGILGFIIGMIFGGAGMVQSVKAVTTVISNVFAAVVTPLFMVVSVKLFHSLKQTKVAQPASAPAMPAQKT